MPSVDVPTSLDVTIVDYSQADSNYETALTATIERDAWWNKRILMRANLAASLPARAVITSGLLMYHADGGGPTFAEDPDVLVYRLPDLWEANEVTWNDRSAGVPWASPGGDPDTGVVSVFTARQNEYSDTDDITEVVDDAWRVRDGLLNVMLRWQLERSWPGDPEMTTPTYWTINSSENGTEPVAIRVVYELSNLTFYLTNDPMDDNEAAAHVAVPVMLDYEAQDRWLTGAMVTQTQHDAIMLAHTVPASFDGSVDSARAVLRANDMIRSWWLFDHFAGRYDIHSDGGYLIYGVS